MYNIPPFVNDIFPRIYIHIYIGLYSESKDNTLINRELSTTVCEYEVESRLKTLDFATYLCFFIFGISETSTIEPVFGWNLFLSKLSFPRLLLLSYPFVYSMIYFCGSKFYVYFQRLN